MTTLSHILPKRQSLLRSTSLVSIMTFCSRLTGFARDMLIAQLFGATAGMDAFLVAFRIPNFMRRLFAEGAFSQAFVPVLAEYQQTQSTDEVRTFIARVAGQLLGILTVVVTIGMLLTPFIILIFAPGFAAHSARAILATMMLKITFPYLMLISLTAMSGAVLNTYGHFGIPAITPLWLNVVMIACALYLSPWCQWPIMSLAWGVLLAGIIQFLFQLPFLWQKKLLVKPAWVRGDKGVQRVIKLMIPALFGVSIAQLNLMIDSIFASFLEIGSVSWLYFTDRLTDFPLGVFGVAIATVILPHLSRRHADQNIKRFSQALDWGLRSLLIIGIPAMIGLAFFSMPLIACCFAYGKFNLVDLIQTQKSLIALSLGVPAFMMVKVLASGFYAQQDIKTPVKIGALAMIVNSLLCALLITPLAHAGLALASTLASYVNCALLLGILIKRQVYRPETGWIKFIMILLISNAILSGYLYQLTGTASMWLSRSPFWRLGLLTIDVIGAIGLYLLILWLCGIRLNQFRQLNQEIA